MGNNLLGLLLRKNGRCSVLRMFSISLNLTNMAYAAVTCSREQMSTRILDWFMLSTTFNCVIHVTHAVFSFELASVWKLSLTKLLRLFQAFRSWVRREEMWAWKTARGWEWRNAYSTFNRSFFRYSRFYDWSILTAVVNSSLPWLEMWCNSDVRIFPA